MALQLPSTAPATARRRARDGTARARPRPAAASDPRRAAPAPIGPREDRLAAVLARVVGARGGGRPAGPLLQRMSLEQTGWLGDLEDIGERDLVTDGRTVRVYYKEGAEASSKAAALATAAQINATVGKAVDDRAYASWRAERGWGARAGWDANAKWTAKSAALGDASARTLDPFFLGVKVPYRAGTDAHALELLYQHASNWTGYVEALYDSANVATRAVPTMYDLGSEDALKGTRSAGGHWRNLLYSNKHDFARGVNLLGASAGASAASLDAYTKIAGEGARWQCVRKHGAALQDDTMFYVAHGDATKRGISFRVLWLNWKSVFGKAYDIADGEVAAAIRAGLAQPRGTSAAIGRFARDDVKVVTSTAQDFNLDTGLAG